MVARVFIKNRSSSLRNQIKLFKEHSEDLALLASLEPGLRRTIYLSNEPVDVSWRGEGHHQLALYYWKIGEIDKARKSFIDSISCFGEDEILGLCRTKRDHALFLATHDSVQLGLYEAEQALLLHNDDLPNQKGLRQKQITLGYLWYLRLQQHRNDGEAQESLIEFALHNCHDCSIRDQQQLLRFALDYANGSYRQQLRMRLGVLYASSKQPVQVAKTAIQLGIDLQLFVASRALRLILRRE